MNQTLKIRILALAVMAVLVLPSAAFARSSQDGYGGPNNVVAGIQNSGGGDDNNTPSPTATVSVAPQTATADEGSSLPFTGADLGVLVAAGAVMLAFGFGLRRLTHSPSRP